MRKFFVRLLSCFIFSSAKRKAFRKKILSVPPVLSQVSASFSDQVPALKQYKQDNFIIQHNENKNHILYLYTSNTSNIGDLWSSPKNYFYFNATWEEADIVKKFNDSASIDNSVIILGGGIHPWLYFDKDFTVRLNSKKCIGWGIGQCTGDIFPELFLKKMTLIGIREYTYPFIDNKKIFFCPCSSCMNSIFDRKFETKHDMVFYTHYMQKNNFKDSGEEHLMKQMPCLTNYAASLAEVIAFIASGEVVCTNSYHGAYWATLLGKKVIYRGYARKWSGFKHPPVYVENFSDIKDSAKRAISYPEALEECRSLNKAFYNKVCETLPGF